MVPKIPKLKSRYIPVHSSAYVIESEIHWWKRTSPFVYPNVLINLLSCTKEQIDKLRSNSDEELFLLCDSGGFQVISGTCNIDWKHSLEKQIELGASKIFAFDKPPVKPKFQGSLSQFTYMTDLETRKIIEENLDVAIVQSLYLKENYPEERKKFCYILHGKNFSHLQYNLDLIEKKIGLKNYLEYFPGGITYAIKGSDILFITMSARHAYENFVKKGIYVHFLGMGSFNRMIILVRNEITTFDSSSILQGTRANMFINPIQLNNNLQISSTNISFESQFCLCPVCSRVDYHKLIAKGDLPMVGRHGISHNLWHTMSINTFLDSVKKNRYTEVVIQNFKINKDIKRCLEFCDFADKNGYDIAYEKYKHYLKKDETKQNTLF